MYFIAMYSVMAFELSCNKRLLTYLLTPVTFKRTLIYNNKIMLMMMTKIDKTMVFDR